MLGVKAENGWRVAECHFLIVDIFFIIQLTKSMAVEFAKKNVRVNCISPGYIGTELTLNAPKLAPLIEGWKEMTPVGRMGTPEELQAIAVYLAGDASDFTTGSDFVIDGGFTNL